MPCVFDERVKKMSSSKKFILIIFILALFTPQVLFAYQNYNQQKVVTEELLPATVPPDSSTEAAAVKEQELSMIPAPPGKTVSISILMYHEIGEGPDCMWVTEKDFYDQMKYLHDNGYQTITLSQAVKLLNGNYDTSQKVVLTFDDGYDTFYSKAWPVLQGFNQQATVFIISELVERPGYLNWEQINILAANNIEIGGHTRTHPLLPTLTSSRSYEEIVGAKQDIEAGLGKKTTSFCYPTGQYNSQVVGQVKTAGYSSGVTMVQRRASSADDLFLLPRLGVYKDDPLDRFKAITKQP